MPGTSEGKTQSNLLKVTHLETARARFPPPVCASPLLSLLSPLNDFKSPPPRDTTHLALSMNPTLLPPRCPQGQDSGSAHPFLLCALTFPLPVMLCAHECMYL